MAAQSAWEQRDSGTTANLWGFSGGVAVGEQGVILTTSDQGATWTRRFSGTTAWLTAVSYDSQLKRYTVVGEGGMILSSPDGVGWTREASPTAVRLNGVSGDGGIAVGEAGAGALTRDANGGWTRADAGFGNRWMRGVWGGQDNAVAVGQGGAIFTRRFDGNASPPGLAWQSEPSPVAADLEAIALGGAIVRGIWIVVGADGAILRKAISEPDSPWTPCVSPTRERLRGVVHHLGGSIQGFTRALTYVYGEFFAVGSGGTIVRSAEGSSWQIDSAPTRENLNAVGNAGGYVVAVGNRGVILRTGGPGAAPVITRQPRMSADAQGEVFAEASAAGQGSLTYQWLVPLPGGGYLPVGTEGPRQSFKVAPSGRPYQLAVANAFGLAWSDTFLPNRFLNLSSRGTVGAGEAALIGGLAIGGNGSSQPRVMLIRAAGPALAGFGVAGALRTPRLSLYAGSQVIASNAGWDTGPDAAEVRAAAQKVGAFPLAAGSADCALLVTLPPGLYTAQVTGADGATGVALVEAYDTEPPGFARLINLSARAQVLPGAGAEIGGLVIDGGVRKKTLLRAAGPALAAFGVAGVLAKPRMTLVRDGTVVATAAEWGAAPNAAAIREAARAVNAFAFAEGSADAALLTELKPGAYSVVVTGADGGSGVALVEVYEVP